MRLDKYLASAGAGSRQEVKKYIRQGRVCVNGQTIRSPEAQVNESGDSVSLDREELIYEAFHYIMLNKPQGYVCSADEKGQKSVLELVGEPYGEKLFPVGRLDKDTEGLLLLTDDGKLAHDLLSPGKHVWKQYYARLEKPVSPSDQRAFEGGLAIGDGKPTLPAKLKILPEDNAVIVSICEGRFHQIKRMFKVLGNSVQYLKRIQMKNLALDESLACGAYRRLTPEEVEDLKQ